MTRGDRLTTRAEREAFREIRRVCCAGLDSATLRKEVGRRAGAVVPVEAYALMSTDPETGLFTHGLLERVPEAFVQRFIRDFYIDEAIAFLDVARSGGGLTTWNSGAYQEALRAHGLEHRAHLALAVDNHLWGTWCLFREASSRPFGDREKRFLRAVAPHIARGMQAAAALDAATEDEPAASAPGVLVLDSHGRAVLRSGPAAAHLEDLADLGRSAPYPYAIVSVLARLRWSAADGVDPGVAPAAELRAQGRSGRAYLLRASLAEPNEQGESSTVVVIEPSTDGSASALAVRHGLTPREREVLLLAARGESSKQIASQLQLSAYTVQEHLGNACTKVGVRGRRALLARLFFDGAGAGAQA
jgi:DNA-binding CsgD family transcriptional regulator/GAF domain-containing protein